MSVASVVLEKRPNRSQENLRPNLFKQRTLTAIALLPMIGLMVWLGGGYFAIFFLLILGTAGYEWVHLFRTAGFHPSFVLVITGVVGFLLIDRFGEIAKTWFWLLFLLCCLAYAILQYEKGTDSAPVDFLVHAGAVLYIGGLGIYFFLVRNLVNGELWFLFLVTLTSIGDTGAYLIGQRWGSHKMGRRVSPNKSWEGYAAGIITAALTGLGFGLLGGAWFTLRPVAGMVFAGFLYAIIPIGDFGISMFKRWAGVKNTSNLLPGHGGILDRIDTHLWTMALGYHILNWLVFAG